MKYQKILLDRDIYLDNQHNNTNFDGLNISSLISQIGIETEWIRFPNKESVLLCDHPMLLSGRTILKAFKSKEFDNFQSWLEKFFKKNHCMTIVSEQELFHPEYIDVLHQIDDFGKPCRILTPWRYGTYKNIKEYYHDLNAFALHPFDRASSCMTGNSNFFSVCRTTIKPDRPGRAELIKNLEASNQESKMCLLDYNMAVAPDEYAEHMAQRQKEGNDSRIPFDVYANCQVEIVCETNTTRPEVFYPTEKIYKPICGEIPFIALAAKGFLAGLRHRGFMTFGDIFDEGYDKIDDLDHRINAICDLVKDNQKRDLKKLCRHITRHNRKKFYEIYSSARVQYTEKLIKLVKLIK